MKRSFFIIISVFFSLRIVYAGESYEFGRFSGYTETGYSKLKSMSKFSRNFRSYKSEYSSNVVHQVKLKIRPEECRFYLSYNDEGKGHTKLLKEALEARDHLEKAFNDIDRERVRLETYNYNPEKSMGGIFRSEREEINMVFRVVVKLDTKGEERFWNNAQLVAEVLDKITEIRKDHKYKKKINSGQVLYAVKSIEPIQKKLLEIVNQEVNQRKEAFARANKVSTDQLISRIQYDTLRSYKQALNEIEVAMPYKVFFEIKEEKKNK